jgi:hypothetical protein
MLLSFNKTSVELSSDRVKDVSKFPVIVKCETFKKTAAQTCFKVDENMAECFKVHKDMAEYC